MVAQQPVEIDGEADSETDENSSSSSEEGTLCFLLSVLFYEAYCSMKHTVQYDVLLENLNVLFLCTMYCFYVLCTVSIKRSVQYYLLHEKLNVLFLCTMYCFH